MQNELTDEQMTRLLWQNGRIEYLFTENQEYIYEELNQMVGREVSLLLARRFGKSYFAIIYAAMMCLTREKFRVGIVAKSQEQVRKIVGPITEWLMSEAPSGFIKKTTSRFELNFPTTGSRLVIMGAEASADNYRGIGLDLAICEETASWEPQHYENMMKFVLKPMLRLSKEKLKIIHCTTPSPKYVDHPFHDVMLQMPHLKLTIYDDMMITDEMVKECIDDCCGEDTHAFRVEYLCEVTRNSNLSLLPAFNRDTHKFKLITDQNSGLIGVFDLGGTRDKSAYIEAYRKESIIYVTHAKLWDNMTPIEEMAQYMLARPVKVRVGDLSGQSAIEFQQRGLSFLFPSKTDFETMLTELNNAFYTDSILIHEDLKELIDNCIVGQFNTTRTDFARTEKYGHCDLLATLNYTWRMRKQFNRLDRDYEEEIHLSSLSHRNTNLVHHNVKQNKKMKALQSLTGLKKKGYS